MKKKFLVCLLCVFCACFVCASTTLLQGCDNSNTNNTSTQTPDEGDGVWTPNY